MDRAAENHYPTSPLAEIKALDVKSIAAADCVLFLWSTVPMLDRALEVMKAWGFEVSANSGSRTRQMEPELPAAPPS
jgi:N6-adenosine-specific RNA methylase IME4